VTTPVGLVWLELTEAGDVNTFLVRNIEDSLTRTEKNRFAVQHELLLVHHSFSIVGIKICC